jgi:glutathione S-transferase
MLEVWGRRSSFNVQKVMWLIGELGLAHRHIPAGGVAGPASYRKKYQPLRSIF